MSGTVLITGAGKRIGRAIAICFAGAGYRVVVHYNKSLEEAEGLVEELGDGGHTSVYCDFNCMSEVVKLIPELIASGIKPDVLVNNASCYSRVGMRGAVPEAVERAFRINFAAPFELMRSFAEHCGRGAVINITDQRTAYTDPAAGPYGLAKKALEEATAAAALEWAPEIRVNAVAPGIVLPPPGKSWKGMEKILHRIPSGRRTGEAEIAEACLFLAGAGARSITGQTLYLDGGLHLLGKSIESGS